MNTKLYIITGATGTGKSTLVPLLTSQLPENYRVYDYDLILRPYDKTSEWAWEVLEKMFQITQENIEHNLITVVAGLIRPYQLEKVADKYNVQDIKLCLLDISTNERERRLSKRGDTEELIEEVAEHVGFRSWIKESKYPYEIFDTTNEDSNKIADQVTNWIHQNS